MAAGRCAEWERPGRAGRARAEAAGGWLDVRPRKQTPARAIAGGLNRVEFAGVSTAGVRVLFTRPENGARFRLIELKAFAPGD